MFKFLDIQVSHFRGFVSETQRVNLKADLAIFYGPNGFGKSSLSEAIEWLFYGCTKRRKRGDSLSKIEYKDSYANAHGGSPVKVSATIVFPDGTEHIIARQMENGSENSFTMIDETPGDFESIGIQPLECFYPVVAQSELQSFIHTQPKNRRDEISAALGLEELTSLKTALQGLNQSLSLTPPAVVYTARRELKAPIDTLANQEIAKTLHGRWSKQQFNYDLDWPDIVEIANGFLGMRINTKAELIKSLSIKVQEIKQAIFDNNKLSFGFGADKNLPAFEQQITLVSTNLTTLCESITRVLAAQGSALSAEILEFWEKGLHLAGADSQCPMCEEPTFTQQKKERLQKRILENAEVKQNHDKLKSDCTAAGSSIQALSTQAKSYILKPLSEAERKFLKGLFPPDSELFQQFFSAFDQHISTGAEFQKAVDAVAFFVRQLPATIADPAQATECVENCTTTIANLTTAYKNYAESIITYMPIKENFSQSVSRHIASSDSVCAIEALQKIIEHDDAIVLLTKYEKSLQTIKSLMQETEDHINDLQKTLLETRGKEVKDWYDTLNPNAEVGFEVMEPGTGQLKLHASSFGKRMSAAANLGECQLNCLGLAVWIMRATSKQSSFGFIVFDDPIQSMDDDHTESFISDVIQKLIDDHGKQVIVLSHTEKLTKRLKELYGARICRHYHFTRYSAQGPQLVEQVKIQQDIGHIKSLMDGDEREREIAVEKIRELGENVIRKLYLVKNQQPLPARYDRAEPNELLEVFKKIDGTTATEHNGLKDTFTFSSPAHHTDPNYSTPVKANIMPHYSRLEKIIRDYNLT